MIRIPSFKKIFSKKLPSELWKNSKSLTICPNKFYTRSFMSVNVFQKNKNLIKFVQTKNNVLKRFYSDYPPHVKVLLPALSPTMEMGTIVSWEKKQGDKLNEGDLLAEIETDKATMGFETPEEGYLAKILVPAGTKNVLIGTLVCIIVDEEKQIEAFKDFKDVSSLAGTKSKSTSVGLAPVQVPAVSSSAPKQQLIPPKLMTPLQTTSQHDRVYASPLAKKLANEKGISLTNIQKRTGLYASITSSDLSSISPTSGSVSTPSTAYNDIDISNIRSVIAQRLLLSKQTIPHYYLNIEVSVDKLLKLRKDFNYQLEKDKIKLSINDFIIKASSLASIKVSEVNSSWKDTYIRQYNNVDVSVAVSTDKGLITPIIFKANKKGLIQINQEMKTLAQKARDGKLQPHEFQGGTLSISNLGMFGIKQFSAVINPPQSSILAVGSLQDKLLLDESKENGLRHSQILSITLSCDHRVVDGAVGARWLNECRRYLEEPSTMLL